VHSSSGAPPVRDDERERLDILRSLGVLDTDPEESYERVVHLAVRLLGVPIALVTLVDDERQWFKARIGLDFVETERAISFCAHAISSEEEIFVVEDTHRDARFAGNPLVTGDPHIRFYAGRILRCEGRRVGTLCVIDRVARQLTGDDARSLQDLAVIVEDLLSRRGLRRAVVALSQSEARKDQILATMHDGLVVQEPTGAIVNWNQAAEVALGLSAEELSGRTSIDPRWRTVHEDGTPWPGETHPAKEALRTGQSVQNALMGVHRPKLGLGWLRVSSSPVIEDDGSVSGVITSFTDVTELKAADENLRRSEKLQRLTLDLLEQGVIVAIAGGGVELMNAAAEKILGYTASELSMRWRHDDWKSYREDGTEFELADRPLLRTFRNGEHISGEIVAWEKPNGRRVLVSLSTAAIPNDPRRYMITFVDLTQRRRDRQLLELTFENAPIGMALIDPKGRLAHVNEALCEFLGRDRTEIQALRFEDVTHPDDHLSDRLDVASLIDGTRDSYENEKRYIHGDGSIVYGHLAVAILRNEKLREPYFLAQVLDIGHRREAERAKDEALAAQSQAVAKLVELDRIKTDLVSTVSHELRTPLASMIGYLELLLEDGSIAEEPRVMLGVVDRNAHRLLSLIENLLTLSRVELDAQRMTRTNAALDQMVESALATVEPLADAARVSISSVIAADVPVVFVDPVQIERVLLNLLTNAIKFTPPEGLVTITIDRAGPDARILVGDTGMGIPADEMSQLFTRFFRSSTSVAQSVPGTGLGLAISYNIVSSHGGTIRARSTVGVGSVFEVTLPGESRSVDDVTMAMAGHGY
jgi:PAS domain S-box-containing protein